MILDAELKVYCPALKRDVKVFGDCYVHLGDNCRFCENVDGKRREVNCFYEKERVSSGN
ncbi:MAG: hypothetical protein ACOCRO_07305 [Halanaerobiales bacterium]